MKGRTIKKKTKTQTSGKLWWPSREPCRQDGELKFWKPTVIRSQRS